MCTREYTDKDGNSRKATEVVLKAFRGELTLLESAKAAAPDANGYGQTSSRKSASGWRTPERDANNSAPQGGTPYRASDALDDDIPF